MEISYTKANINSESDVMALKELTWEYLNWGNNLTIENHGFNFDILKIHDNFVSELPLYNPPEGRIYLVKYKNDIIGMGGFKKLNNDTCELKRLFIKEEYRGQQIGYKLLKLLISEAQKEHYSKIVLESARVMRSAYKLYCSMGFKEIDFYEGMESPKEFLSIIYCMELDLWT